ncbi:TRAPP II complex [Triangularia setosa]|uniref:TRAPP II complex n=1 Tax=Triangularia setosa TaxID=2587417 RepID=A0AAN7A6M1_9PEZI|nr:TRAPP II complex [Podospora setosa]
MTLDPFIPIAPARIKVLVLPIGHIKRERFTAFISRLNEEHIVHLRDVTPDGRPHRNMFSPLAFPGGAMFYELMTHQPSPSHLALSPFDLWREQFAVIAIADGAELGSSVFNKRHSGAGGRTVEETNIRTLYQDLENLRDQYPKMLAHQVLIFDYLPAKESPIPIPEGIITIPPPDQLKRTTIKTVMCDISAIILAEMTTLAKSFEGLAHIDSPGVHTSAVHERINGLMGQDGMARRNSQYTLPGSRSVSATGLADRTHVRMSMPPVSSSKTTSFGSSTSTPSARPTTPLSGNKPLPNPPLYTFDNIIGPASSSDQTLARSDTTDSFSSQSQQPHDKVSVHGFGSGGMDARMRSKSRCRIQVVIGSLYLQSGLWSNALKELTEAATVAKSINDHVWHGKALELCLVCLLLLGWAGIEFAIPSVLLPPSEKGSGIAQQINEAEQRDPRQEKWLRHLQCYMPELVERILGLYSRLTAECLPPVPWSEAVVRFARMLTALHVAGGKLGEESLGMMVMGMGEKGGEGKQLTTSPRFTINPTRTVIVQMLFRAFPASAASELLMTVDRVTILSGIASVLGMLGFQRKKAMVVRELVSVLVGGLVEARTRGAADVGIHPAAGLVGLNGMNGQGGGSGAGALDLAEGDIEHGIESFLGVLLKTYGIVGDVGRAGKSRESMTVTVTDDNEKTTTKDTRDTDQEVVARIQRQSAARFFGMQTVKLNILRSCINFSEALPDFAGVLKYSSDLLRTAGSGIAPGPRREDAYPAISREEQVRLTTNILKTSNLSKRMGIGELAAEYWDEFLLRGIRLEPLSITRAPVAHAKTVLPGATTARASQDVDPFIYNPFLKRPDTATVESTLVAGEPATFRLTLQNPFEMEVDIESIRLDAEGAGFESGVEHTVIGPYRTQILRISGTPKAAGTVKITGAVIKVRGCRERRFPIFVEPWAPDNEGKTKSSGLVALEANAVTVSPAVERLKPYSFDLKVISPQPTVAVKSSTLPQSSVMILEGERQRFSVTLQNLSPDTPVDFLLFSFKDSTQEPLQAALNSRDATATELYEYELILAKKQALRLRNRDRNDRFIAPGQTATFDFEILGKPGLTNGIIQVDYAHLGVPLDEIAEQFYTRQVSMELTVTVNASIDISRVDVIPLNSSIPGSLWTRSTSGKAQVLTPETHCLLLLDLRNSWPSQMTVSLSSGGSPPSDDDEDDHPIKMEEHILPGNTTRLVLPIRRVYLEDPHAFIPALNPSRQRQFVVSTKISPEAERATREAFWYREKILDSLRGTWKTFTGKTREGEINFRSIRFNSKMVEVIKVDELDIDISLSSGGSDDGDNKEGVKGWVYVDEFLELRVKITNRGSKPVLPLLRLCPVLRHRPFNVSLDFTRKMAKFAWNGNLQFPLGRLEGNGGVVEVTTGVTVLCRGEFEIGGSVEEVMAYTPSEADKDGEQGKVVEDFGLLMVGGRRKERKVWHARKGCRVVVRDRPGE